MDNELDKLHCLYYFSVHNLEYILWMTTDYFRVYRSILQITKWLVYLFFPVIIYTYFFRSILLYFIKKCLNKNRRSSASSCTIYPYYSSPPPPSPLIHATSSG